MVEIDPVLFEQVLFNFWTMQPNMRLRARRFRIQSWRDRESVASRSWTKATAFRRLTWNSIFDKFYRAQKADHVRPGTGLGLAISRGFVEAMNGTIVGGQPNRSNVARCSPSRCRSRRSRRPGYRRMTATPLKILVIDDEPPIRKLLRMGLTPQGYQTLEAPNGKIALELLNQKPALSFSTSVCRISRGTNC